MARKSMNIIDLEAWVRNTGETIRGQRITNIYYSREENVLLLKIKGSATEGLVLAEPGKRIHMTRRVDTPKEYKPFPLVVLSRKMLRGSRISHVEIIGGDRIVSIESDRGYKLIVELIPRGFIVLLDSDNMILAADRYDKMKDRVIKPKIEYKPPPGRGLRLEMLDAESLREILSGQRDLVRGLIRGLGIPGEAAEEACFRAGLDPSAKPSSLSMADYAGIIEALEDIWKEAVSSGHGYIAYSDNNLVEADPFEPRRFSSKKVYESFDEALDVFFLTDKILGTGVTGQARDERVEKELEKLRRSLEQAIIIESEYRRKASELRSIAERIPMYYDVVNRILDCIKRRNPYECSNVVDVSSDKRQVTIEVNGIRFNARIGEDVDALVVRLFREAGEYEAKAERARASRGDIEKKLRDAELKATARLIQERTKQRPRYWFEKYHWTITRSGILAIGGRDAGQNESIVKRYLDDNDIFIHAEIHGAPAVVVKARGRELSTSDLMDAAVITVAYSRGWREGVGSLAAYWVWGSQVSKTPPSGEYVARGGFIIRGRRNYLPPLRMRLALGISVLTNNMPMVIVGSEHVVSKHSIVYAIIEPGDHKVEAASKEIKRVLEHRVDARLKPVIMAVPEGEIAFRLPGRSRIVGVGRGEGKSIAEILQDASE